jgi:hypothetical protein
LFTHGIQNQSAILGPGMEAMLAAMVERWNRPPFRLHFVTAREAYNIVKAAEAGLSGNPNEYRDYESPPPANRCVWCSAPYQLLSYAPDRVHLELLGEGPATVQFARGPLRLVRGKVRSLDARFEHGELAGLTVDGEMDVAVSLSAGTAGAPDARAENARRIVLRSGGRLIELSGQEQAGRTTLIPPFGSGLDVSDSRQRSLP